MYGTNPYMSPYNQQASIDRINSQIAELEKMKQQLPQQPVPQATNLTQNFQLAPTNKDVIRYANSMEEVQRDMVVGDTPYFSKDMSVVWIKNSKGEIKTYELNEIVPKDEKDLQIEYLISQVAELKKGIEKYESNANDDTTNNETSATKNDESVGNAVEKSKPTSISRVSTGKKK